MNEETFDYSLKFLTLGDSNVGKTTFICNYADEPTSEKTISTIGIDFKRKKVHLSNGKIVQITLIDTVGQERFRRINASYFKGANCVFFIFDLTAHKTFETLEYWFKELNEKGDSEDLTMIIIGNKCDKPDIEVTPKEIKMFSKEKKVRYFEISAIKKTGFHDLFNYAIIETLKQELLKNNDKQNYSLSKYDSISLGKVYLMSDVGNKAKKNVICCL